MQTIFDSTIVVLSVIVLVVISALIVSSITDNSVFTDIPTTGTITNETLTAVNATDNSTYAIISTAPNAICVFVALYNATGGELLTAGNYTAYPDCKIILEDLTEYSGEDLNVTYDYSYASGTSSTGLNVTKIRNDFGSFITNLVAFIAILGTIIGVIWLVLYVRRLFDKKEGLQGITA